MNTYIFPVVCCTYLVTLFSLLLSYKVFGSESKIKTKLYYYLDPILNNNIIRRYFSYAYLFYIWLFCIGENEKLWLRFNIIISVTEILTLLGLFFRLLLITPIILSQLNTSFILIGGVIFALNALLKVFINSGVFINNLFDSKNLTIVDPQGEFITHDGNVYFKTNRSSASFSPGENPDPQEEKKQSSRNSQTRFARNKKVFIYLGAGTIVATFVAPITAEFFRQHHETESRNQTQKHEQMLSQEKTKRVEIKAKADADIAKAKADADIAKAKADTAKADADIARYHAKLAKENRRIIESKTNNASVFQKYKDSWNKKP